MQHMVESKIARRAMFGDVDPRTVTLEKISGWRKKIEGMVSLREAHRCVKIWRAIRKVSAALGYCVRDADPSLARGATVISRPRSDRSHGQRN